MPRFQLRRPPNLLDNARGDQNGRRVGLGSVLIVAMIASAVLWAVALRFLLALWI